MYSPFTLFADACVADAKDKRKFEKLVRNFVKDSSYTKDLKEQLSSWCTNHKDFEELKSNPKLSKVEPLSKNLASVSSRLLALMDAEVVETTQVEALHTAILKLKNNDIDVEFVIIESLQELATYYKEMSLKETRVIE